MNKHKAGHSQKTSEDTEIEQQLQNKEIMSYVVEIIDDLPVSVFRIDNSHGSLSLDMVQKWFSDNNLVPPKCTLEDNQIKIEISYQWKGKPPYETTILSAISIFRTKGIELTEDAKESLFHDMIEAEAYIRQLRLKYSIPEPYFMSLDADKFPAYLKSFYGLFLKVESVFGVGSVERAKEELLNKDADIKAEIIEKKLLEIFDHSSTVKQSPDKPDALASIVITSDHWDAFGRPPAKGVELVSNIRKFFTDQYQDSGHAQFKLSLDVAQLNDDTRTALQNLLAYTAKLQAELESLSEGKKKSELAKKLNRLKLFVEVVFEKEKLTAKDLEKEYLKFEQLDVNRGTGLYRIHSAFHGKSFFDKNKKKRYVKSTAGELVYNLMEALKTQKNKSDNSESEGSENSSGM